MVVSTVIVYAAIDLLLKLVRDVCSPQRAGSLICRDSLVAALS